MRIFFQSKRYVAIMRTHLNFIPKIIIALLSPTPSKSLGYRICFPPKIHIPHHGGGGQLKQELGDGVMRKKYMVGEGRETGDWRHWGGRWEMMLHSCPLGNIISNIGHVIRVTSCYLYLKCKYILVLEFNKSEYILIYLEFNKSFACR